MLPSGEKTLTALRFPTKSAVRCRSLAPFQRIYDMSRTRSCFVTSAVSLRRVQSRTGGSALVSCSHGKSRSRPMNAHFPSLAVLHADMNEGEWVRGCRYACVFVRSEVSRFLRPFVRDVVIHQWWSSCCFQMHSFGLEVV